MANNRKATRRCRARQEKAREPPEKLLADRELRDLIRNLNWLLGMIRTAVESKTGRVLGERLRSLAGASCIINGLTLDSQGWAALLGLKNARSFSKIKRRRQIAAHKPGQTLMFSAADLLRAAARETPGADHGRPNDETLELPLRPASGHQ